GTLKPLTKEVLQEVILKNLPETQKVEVTNQKEVQDVNVTNQTTSVDVNNFPEIQDVSDAQVKTKLDLIEQHQQEMLDRMKEGFQSTSKTFVTLTEYVDAEAVEAGGKVNIPINMQGASKLVVLVSFDGQWKGSVATLNSLNASDGENNIFPDTFREVQKSKSF